ncbi:hypothetical protein TRAPUB_2508 [Trametes pubescens]|uniref:Uncharacterized protein n=1 Tax=Trametes pubescens TaxID=154538 RepID=A0A1M2VGC5_TRAPU|nr:hypothetical protein TRAPUB_2508 [Trametes pubescens]
MSDKNASIVRNAERNNDKLFPIFQKNLSSDNLAEFATAADKLSGWLSRDKAYYTKARPMIISLMETAHETVLRHSGSTTPFHVSRVTDDVRPWADAYVKILRTVMQFTMLFSENALQLRLRTLLQALCDNVDAFLSQQTLFSPSATNSPIASVAGTPGVSLPPPSTLQPVVPRPSSTGPPRFDPANPPKLTDAQILAVLALAKAQGSLVTSTPSATAVAAPSGAPALPQTPAYTGPTPLPRTDIASVSPVNPTPSPAAADPAMAPEHSRKVKRRKTLPVDLDFIEADLNWYKDTHTAEAAGNQDVTGTAPSTGANTPSLVPGAYPTPETSEDVKPLVGIAPQAVPTSQDRLPTPSNLEAAPVAKSRSPSVPLRDASRTASVPQPERISEGEPHKLLAKEEPAPESPVMLAPSLTRRSSELNGDGSTPSASPLSAPLKALSPLAGDPLPSPLATKKTKKRKRGPPGLKFLPILTPSGEQPPEPMAVDLRPPEPMVVDEALGPENGSTNTQESSTRSASASVATPPVPPEPAPPKGQAFMDPSEMLKETAAAAESPVPMDIETDSDRSAEIVLNGDAPSGTEPDPALSAAARPPSDEHTGTRETPSTAPTELFTNGKASTPPKEPEVESVPSILPSLSKASTPTPAAEPLLAVLAVPPPPTTNGFAPSINTSTAMDITTAPDDQSPFASTSARVLSMARGASTMTPASRPVVLEFELSADELAQIARWTDRSKSSDDLSKALCITFASYTLAQLQDDTPESPEGAVDIAKYGRPAPWPQDGTAFVALNVGEGGQGGERFTISPPFISTVDKCVDLGTRKLHAGLNSIHLFQYRDHSDRAFLALLHHPTRAQLAELQATRDREREWRQFLHGLGHIELQVPRLFPASLLGSSFVSPS